MTSRINIHILDDTGKTSRTFVNDEMDNPLLLDDTIQIVKNKIIYELKKISGATATQVAYGEIYLFSKKNLTYDVGTGRFSTENLYKNITKHEKIHLTKKRLAHFLKQIGVDFGKELDNNNDNNNNNIDYIDFKDTLTKLLNKSSSSPHYYFSLGQRLSTDDKYHHHHHEPNLMFSANPFLFDTIEMQTQTTNNLESFENELLFNYIGNENNHYRDHTHIHNIYVCFLQDVVKYICGDEDENATSSTTLQKQVIQTYFPLLYIKGVYSIIDNLTILQKLRKETAQHITAKTISYYKSIQLFYDIYDKYSKTAPLKYIVRGIKSCKFKINSNIKNILPLEVIFKNIHATESMPFIKYNPGNKRENIYRFYTQTKTKDGKYIPTLGEPAILNLSKTLGKSKQISLFISNDADNTISASDAAATDSPNSDVLPTSQSEDSKTDKNQINDTGTSRFSQQSNISFYINFEINGDIQIVIPDLKEVITIEMLTKYVLDKVNPVIENINAILQQTGYSINKFTSFDDLTTCSIINIKYILKYDLQDINKIIKKTELKKIKCIAGVFDIVNSKKYTTAIAAAQAKNADEIYMTFKRVENFKEFEGQSALIHNVYKNTNSYEEVIKALIDNYKIDKDEAENILKIYLDQGDSVTIDNAGFPVTLNVAKNTSILTIEIDEIIDFTYITTLQIYFDTILRITQKPKTITAHELLKKCFKEIPSGASLNNTASIHQNIITTNAIQITASKMASSTTNREKKAIIDFDDDDNDDAYSVNNNNNNALEFEEDDIDYGEYGDYGEDIDYADNSNNYIVDEDTKHKGGGDGGGPKKISTASTASKTTSAEDADDEDGDETDAEEAKLKHTQMMERLIGKSSKTNFVYAKLKKLDPVLFMEKEGNNYSGYSRACAANIKAQPIGLTKKEYEKINKEYPGSYDTVLKYGTDPDPEKHNYYICPRYWCLITNTSMTEDDVKNGRCAKLGKPDKIIKGDTIGPEAFVYEFTDKNHHANPDGSYRLHYPGFATGKHPKGYGLPCCYKQKNYHWDQIFNATKSADEDTDEGFEKDARYIISNESCPLKEQRFGFLPLTLQLFLQTDNSAAVTQNNRALIKPNTECILRYGVEHPKGQSFLGCFAELYKFKHNLATVPSVKKFKEILVECITLDKFIKYNNSYLVSVFKPKYTDKAASAPDISKYEDTVFYKSLDIDNEHQRNFLEYTILSYTNFINYLLEDTAVIDHTYLWDIICEDNPKLIAGGVNLVILEIVNNDLTKNIKFICPTNSSNKIIDKSKPSYILLKNGEYYEPIFVYKNDNGTLQIQRVFSFVNPRFKNIRRVLEIIQSVGNKQCASLPSMPKIYTFKRNISLEALYKEINSASSAATTASKYKIKYQISNYQSKIIGLVLEYTIAAAKGRNNNKVSINDIIYVPCYPSGIIPELNDIPIKYIDNPHIDIWNDFKTTVAVLKQLNAEYPNVPCLPKIKVIEDGLIIGILTETNQFIQIDPPSENIEGAEFSELDEINSSNYIIADKRIALTQETDREREIMVKRIELESKFYSIFRTIAREALNDYANQDIKMKLENSIIKNPKLTYIDKLNLTKYILKEIMKKRVTFQVIDEKVLFKINELSLYGCDAREPKDRETTNAYCIKMRNKSGEFIIPKFHLISGVNNISVYFTRVADEIVRYNRIRVFMLNTQNYLNITDTEYRLNENEFILIQSSINNNYLSNLVPYNVSKNIYNVNFETAVPQNTQTYSNDIISLKNQNSILDNYNEESASNDKDQTQESNIVMCIESTQHVIGQERESMWKKIFSDQQIYKEIVFKNSSANCSFYVLIYIFYNKYKKIINVNLLKELLWSKYKNYYGKYKDQIHKVLRKQGKAEIVAKLTKNAVDFQTVIMSEEYYLTDLDIWIFCESLNIQLCLFSKNKIKWFNENIEWIIIGNNYSAKHYFIRTPPLAVVNNVIPKYHVITPAATLGELPDFNKVFRAQLIENPMHFYKFEEYLKTVAV